MKNKGFIASLLLCVLSLSFYAQEATGVVNNPKQKLILKGVVKDNSTKKGLYDATVILTGTDGALITIKTSKKGKYCFFKNKKTV